MSTPEAPTESTTPAEEQKRHPGPRDYVRVAVVLALLTALEVSTYFIEFGALGVPLLVFLMAVKFLYVAGTFMHLRYDTKVFSRLMYLGLSLALILYTLALLIMLLDSAPSV